MPDSRLLIEQTLVRDIDRFFICSAHFIQLALLSQLYPSDTDKVQDVDESTMVWKRPHNYHTMTEPCVYSEASANFHVL